MTRKSLVVPAIDSYVTIVDGDREITAKVAKIDRINDDYFLTFYSWTAIAAWKHNKGYWTLCREDHKNGHPVEDKVELYISRKNKPKAIRR